MIDVTAKNHCHRCAPASNCRRIAVNVALLSELPGKRDGAGAGVDNPRGNIL
jgi:hypothetical protein